MKNKYYIAHNAGNRTVGGEQFEVTQIKGGTAIGVFEATTEAQQKALDAAVKDPKQAVSEITQGEYEAEHKKKAASFTTFKHSNVKPLQTSLKEVAGVVVEENHTDDLTDANKLETVDNALDNVDQVETAPQQ